MTDISVFKKILEQPDAPLPVYVQPRFIWISARKTETGRFCYRVGSGPLSKLPTYSLVDARAVAETYRVPVKEYGPPEAFGRKPKLPAATVDEFWRLVEAEDPNRLRAWLLARPKDVPTLLKMFEAAFPQWGASP
jgi:hypothetical protein